MPYGQKRIPIGARRERVTLRQAVMTTSGDGMGGQTITKWKTVGEPWANVQALDERQKEGLQGEQLTVRHGYFVAIPYSTTVSVGQQIRLRNTTMEIYTVVDDEGLRRRLVLQVGEIQQ